MNTTQYQSEQERLEKQRVQVMEDNRKKRVDAGDLVVVEVPRDVVTPACHYKAGCPLYVTPKEADLLCGSHGGKVLQDKRKQKGVRETAVARAPAKAETPEGKAK